MPQLSVALPCSCHIGCNFDPRYASIVCYIAQPPQTQILGDYDPEVLQRAVQIQNCVVESTTLRVQIGTAAATAKVHLFSLRETALSAIHVEAWEKDIAVELEERLKFECKQLEKLDEMLSVAGTVGAIVSMPVVCSAWDTLCAQLFSRGCQAR